MMPTKLTAKRMKAILERIEGGLPHNAAAALEGVARSTLYNWLRTGARDVEKGKTRTLHARLWAGVQQADAKAFADYLEDASSLAKCSDTPAAARLSHMQWWMEQRFKRHLGKPSQDEVSGVERESGADTGESIVERELKMFFNRLRERLPQEVYVQVLRATLGDDHLPAGR